MLPLMFVTLNRATVMPAPVPGVVSGTFTFSIFTYAGATLVYPLAVGVPVMVIVVEADDTPVDDTCVVAAMLKPKLSPHFGRFERSLIFAFTYTSFPVVVIGPLPPSPTPKMSTPAVK